MFLPIKFRTNIQLSPEELSEDLDGYLKNKLQKSLEGKCSRYGYIKPYTLEIIKRSAGMFIKQHFNGYIKYEVLCKGEVCNPANGMIVSATVKNKNALGLLAECVIDIDGETIPVLDIIIPKKAAGVLSEIDLDNVNIGDYVHVYVLGKRYQLNDKKISIIGKAVKQPVVVEQQETEITEELTEGKDEEEELEEDEEEEELDDEEEEKITKESKIGGKEYDLYTDMKTLKVDGGLLGDSDDDDSIPGGEGEEDNVDEEYTDAEEEEDKGGYYDDD